MKPYPKINQPRESFYKSSNDYNCVFKNVNDIGK